MGGAAFEVGDDCPESVIDRLGERGVGAGVVRPGASTDAGGGSGGLLDEMNAVPGENGAGLAGEVLFAGSPPEGVVGVGPDTSIRNSDFDKLIEGVIAVVPDRGFAGNSSPFFAYEAPTRVVAVAGAASADEEIVAVLESRIERGGRSVAIGLFRVS